MIRMLSDSPKKRFEDIKDHMDNISRMTAQLGGSTDFYRMPEDSEIMKLADQGMLRYVTDHPRFDVEGSPYMVKTLHRIDMDDFLKFIEQKFLLKQAFILLSMRLDVNPTTGKDYLWVRGDLVPFFGHYTVMIRDEKISNLLDGESDR